ncbi:MAG: hypothetical protein ABEJ70_06440 [Halobacteriaceae archaeon]
MDAEAGSLVGALEVRRQALRGTVVGVAVSLALFGFFVVLPGATRTAPVYYVALGFVLAASLSALVTAVLLAVELVRLGRTL